ncbi:Pyruvate kinase, putative, partial [Perkinsus marinus ATCC 50983]
MSTHGYTGRFIKDHCVYGQASIVLSDDMAALSKWVSNAHDTFGRKTKLVCTMGPSCWDVDTLVKMIDQGMNVARLNFSHGDFEAHGATVQRIREALKQRPGKHVALLLDTKGPEIRTGFFKEAGGKVKLEAGQELVLTTDYDHKGDSSKIACSYAKLPQSVKPGSTILMADGTVSLEVIECLEDSVRTRVMNSATIGERKNMNLPGVKVDLPCISEKDKNDILNFGIPQGVNFIAASFVQDGDDVRGLRKLLGPRGRHIKIISKIENESGMKHFDDILAASDGIMIARGDL